MLTKFWSETLKRKRPLGKHRSRWEDNIKMDFREIWFREVDCVHLAKERDQ
jgi:hypothetical protein